MGEYDKEGPGADGRQVAKDEDLEWLLSATSP